MALLPSDAAAAIVPRSAAAPPAELPARSHRRRPLTLTIPGLGNSGAGHWQTRWESTRADCRRIELGSWEKPHRNSWVNHINLAVRAAAVPVVIAAHSLGCIALAWWAKLEPDAAGLVAGALLVAPAEVDFFPFDERVAAFAPTPAEPLPFSSIMVASRNDPWIGHHSARMLARRWHSEFVDAGDAGHLNAFSGLADWAEGQRLLDRLIDGAAGANAAAI